MSILERLQCRQRLEEVAERFGLSVDATSSDCGAIRFAALSHVTVDGWPLDASAAAERARAAGIECDDEGLRLGWTRPHEIERMEDALLVFLGGLFEEDPAAFLRMPGRRIEVPADGALPQSAGWLERFYGDDFLPREKKPAVVDLRHCQGPYLRSVDDEPLQIVDAASQIASLAAGFRPGPVQAALDDGDFDPYLVAAHAPGSAAAAPAVDALTDALLSIAGPGLKHVCFTNGGAEANEKALHLARRNGEGGKRILAFEGSFHGRTLLSLYSTWNPVKRAPFEIEGYETTFAPFPALEEDPYADPPEPAGWRESWSRDDGNRAFEGDALLDAEVASLRHVESELEAGDMLAVIIEPYQCEGGDRAASRRFHGGLRALTRAYGVPLIYDEVQSGFGLSGPVFWHHGFDLLDADGRPDGPDLVVGAKRGQVGYVVSRWPDPTPTTSHVASMVRGRVHLDLVRTRPSHAAHARARLVELAANWGDIVTRPRVFGDAFAFDMPNREAANHLIGQRFYRGYMVYIAGERTLRYRLNRGMSEADVDAIFDVIDRSLTALVEQAAGRDAQALAAAVPPKWVTPVAAASPRPARAPVEVREVDLAGFDAVADQVVALEAEAYEPARRDSLGYFRRLVASDGGVCLLASDDDGLLGMSFAAPIEMWPDLDGPCQDPHRGLGDTLYSADLTVAARAQGRGVGTALRTAMLRYACGARDVDGRPRFAYVVGRNQIGAADAMWALNQRFGAYEVAIYAGQYGRPEGLARYYRIPLRRHDRREFSAPRPPTATLDLGGGVHLPTGAAHPLLVRARDLGVFDEAALTKLTVSNFITRPYARYAEYLRHLAPRGCGHLYFTSCPDEMVDKSLRALKFGRPEGRLAIGVGGGYVGHTTAVCRSITDGDQGYFDWPHVPHPADGIEATVAALDAIVEGEGASAVLGVYVESVQAHTGRVLDTSAWGALCAWRDRTGVPLVLLETTTGLYRSGRGTFWWVESVPGDPDLLLWWAGGQVGHVFSNDATYVAKPLTLISTWDGDELSATRLLWQMYACAEAPVNVRAQQLGRILVEAGLGAALGGLGLYRTLDLGAERARELQTALAEHGVAVERPVEGLLVVAPPITVSEADLHCFAWALARAMS